MKLVLTRIPGLLAVLAFAACSSDDTPEGAPLPPVIHFTALAPGATGQFQIDAQTGGGDISVINLSQTLGVEFLENARREIDQSAIAYYTWEGQQSRLYYKDLATGTIQTELDLCGFAGETDTPKVIRSIYGSPDYFILAYTSFPQGEIPRTHIRIRPRSGGICQDLVVPDAGDTGISDALIQGNLLVLYFRAADTNAPTLSLVDLSTATIITNITPDDNFLAGSLRDEQLYMFFTDRTYQTFHTGLLLFGTSGNTPDFPVPDPGLFSSKFSGDDLLVRFIYQQPSLFFAQPATYNLEGGQFTAGGAPYLPALQARMEAETGSRPLFGQFDTDPETGLSILVYVKGDGSPEGGVVVTDFEGTLVEILPLPLVPDRVLIRDVELR